MATTKFNAVDVINVKVDNLHGNFRRTDRQGHLAMEPTFCALACEFQGARYHVWLAFPSLDPRPVDNGRPILYKNPPLGVKTDHPEYFHTRHLDPTAKFGEWLIMWMRVKARNEHLMDKALEAQRAKEAAEREATERAILANRKKDIVEELYEALEEAYLVMGICGGNVTTQSFHHLPEEARRSVETEHPRLRNAWLRARELVAQVKNGKPT